METETLHQIESLSFSQEGFPPHVKGPIIWANRGNGAFPLCYLRKPKHISESLWREFLDCFTFEVRRK